MFGSKSSDKKSNSSQGKKSSGSSSSSRFDDFLSGGSGIVSSDKLGKGLRHDEQDDIDAHAEAELAKLMGLESVLPTGKKKYSKTASSSSKQVTGDPNDLLTLPQDDVNVDSIELTEDDLNDESLLSELKQLNCEEGIASDEDEQKAADDVVGKRTATSNPNSEIIKNHHNGDEDFQEEEMDLPTRTGSSSRDNTSRNPLVALQAAQTRQNEYKSAALHFKKLNKIADAKAMLLVVNSLKPIIERLEIGDTSEELFRLPPRPDLSIATAADGAAMPSSIIARNTAQLGAQISAVTVSVQKANSPQQRTSAAKKVQGQLISEKLMEDLPETIIGNDPPSTEQHGDETQAIYDRMLVALKAQIATCETLGLQNEKRKFSQDLDLVNSAKLHGLKPPLFLYEEKQLKFNLKFPEIGASELELHIKSVHDFPAIAVGIAPKDLEIFVTYRMDFPSAEAPQKGRTNIVKKGIHADIGYKCMLLIERKKSFERFYRRRGIIFEVYYRKTSLFFTKDVLLGSAELKLSGVEGSSELRLERESVHDEKKKPTGATIDVAVRLREPILHPDVQQRSERWLVLQSGSSAGMPSTINNVPENSSTISSTPSSSPSQAAGKGVRATSAPAKTDDKNTNTSPVSASAARQAATAAISAEVEELALFVNDPANVISNNVMEKEVEALDKQIAAYQAAKKPIPDDLADRKSQYELKMQILVIQVQNNQLTMENYKKMLIARMAEDKELALKAKRLERLDLAKILLGRINLMKEEMKSIEEEGDGEA